jgi:hypothetical protein
MKKQLLFTLFCLLVLIVTVQSPLFSQKWTGGGDGTSWNDPANWDSGEVPGEGALLKVAKDAVITGEVPNNPAQLKVQKEITVTLDLDITFGDGVIEQHALTVAAGSTLNLGTDGNNRTININIAPNKQCIAIFNNDDAHINIAESTMLNIVQGQFGINVGNETCSTSNWGTITFDTLTTTGIKTSGIFNNYGSIMGTARSNGMIINFNGDFVNEEGGVINIGAALDDGLELLDGSTFTNNGALSLMNGPTANRQNSALAINAVATPATFVQNSAIALDITGSSDSSSIFKIDTLGVFENHSVVNVNGTNVDSSLLVSGTFHNMAGAYFNVSTGAINVGETGNFTNDYVLTVADASSAFMVQGTASNNGFYNYGSGAAFAEGSGTITDNGLPFVANIDANGECTVDLANLSLEWFEGENSIGTSDETGALTFAEASLHDKPAVLTTSIEGVEVTVENYCPEAWIDPAGLFNLNYDALTIYPTVVLDQELNVDLGSMSSGEVQIRIYDLKGVLIQTEVLTTGMLHTIKVNADSTGMYLVKASNKDLNLTGKFFLSK